MRKSLPSKSLNSMEESQLPNQANREVLLWEHARIEVFSVGLQQTGICVYVKKSKQEHKWKKTEL